MTEGAAEHRRMRLDVHLHLAGEDRAYLAGLLLGVEAVVGGSSNSRPVIMALQRQPGGGD